MADPRTDQAGRAEHRDDHGRWSGAEVSRGVRAGVVAYLIWGMLTVYWKQLGDFNAIELIGWRVISASVLMAVVVSMRHRWPAIRGAFADRRLTLRITAAAALLTANWTAYVYAISHDRVIETALGYFMAPLGTMALGIIVLHERPTSSQKLAMLLAGLAVIVVTISYGRPPVAALVIAVTWSFYGLLKRQVPLSAVESLAAETFVLLLPAVVVVAVFAGSSTGVSSSGDATELTLVALAGVATVVPLLLFAVAAARVPFTILGPLQYLVPTINFLLGWVLYDEDLPWTRLLGFAIVWAALALVTVDRVRATVADRREVSRLQTATPD